ncbi:unnamed protein product, partial [Sphacelaria rigidula]
MEILKSRVTATTYSRRKRRDDAGEREAEKTTPLLQSTPGSATSAADTNVAAAGDAPPTHEQREENGMRVGVETAGMTGPKDEANKTVRTAICRDKVTLKDKVVTAYSQGKTVSSGIKTIHDGKSKTQTYHAEERACCNMESAEAEVIAAVLVFSGS